MAPTSSCLGDIEEKKPKLFCKRDGILVYKRQIKKKKRGKI